MPVAAADVNSALLLLESGCLEWVVAQRFLVCKSTQSILLIFADQEVFIIFNVTVLICFSSLKLL